MSLSETENWESEKVYRTDSGNMVRSKQERFVANLLTSEGISFEYERKLSSGDGSFRYPDFTLFINGKQYYWEHWGMVDDYSYRQYIAKKVNWYREHGHYDYLIQTWGGGNRDLRGQVMAELHKLRKRKHMKQKESSLGVREWAMFLVAFLILSLFIIAFFSSRQIPAPLTQKPEPEKELQTIKRPDSITQEVKAVGPIRGKKEKEERFYMGIKISR